MRKTIVIKVSEEPDLLIIDGIANSSSFFFFLFEK